MITSLADEYYERREAVRELEDDLALLDEMEGRGSGSYEVPNRNGQRRAKLLRVQCHFCKCDLHVNNNAMTLTMSGKPPAPMGFGWITVIVEPFQEVPCCDECFDKPTTTYLMA